MVNSPWFPNPNDFSRFWRSISYEAPPSEASGPSVTWNTTEYRPKTATPRPQASHSGPSSMSQQDFLRLRYEDEQLVRAFKRNISLRPFPGEPTNEWPSWGVHFTIGRFDIRGRFTPEHPIKPPRFTINPEPRNRHYYADQRGPHLCYTHPTEWSPRYTMATAVAIVLRFINEYEHGKA